ncbi:hypothetical protein HMPREF9080_02722 [Cardiobacterium valvarum F0432]|uniref:Uncharacterized protein n=1 Tax=Cardiobacterium valvarum F0432 TaxID=797473 RepID=G9ZIV5_9GAMM|nr:hypothetical protein HMPREF9080_02722 [Cardiobacterium valvarum F0432]
MVLFRAGNCRITCANSGFLTIAVGKNACAGNNRPLAKVS